MKTVQKCLAYLDKKNPLDKFVSTYHTHQLRKPQIFYFSILLLDLVGKTHLRRKSWNQSCHSHYYTGYCWGHWEEFSELFLFCWELQGCLNYSNGQNVVRWCHFLARSREKIAVSFYVITKFFILFLVFMEW